MHLLESVKIFSYSNTIYSRDISECTFRAVDHQIAVTVPAHHEVLKNNTSKVI